MKIKYLIRKEDLLEAQLLIASQSKNLRARRWVGSILIIVIELVFVAVFCLHPNICLQSFGLLKIVSVIAISVFTGSFYFFLIPYIYRRHYLNQVKTRFADVIGNTVEVQITSDSIETKDESGETKIKLAAIKKVYETGNLFVIQSDNGFYLTIAKQDIDPIKFRDYLIFLGLDLEPVKKIWLSNLLEIKLKYDK
jgi:hypothetical protein